MSIETRACPRCGRNIYEAMPRRPGRPKRWCSARCRRAASEERRAADNGAIGLRFISTEVAIDDQVQGVLDSPAACRRVLRELSERAASGRLSDGRWNSVLAELERMRQPASRPRQRSPWER